MIHSGSWVVAWKSNHVAMAKLSLLARLHVITADMAQGESAELAIKQLTIDTDIE